MKESEIMIRTAILLCSAALGLAAAPAFAASADLSAALEAYAEADASDVRPSEQSDFAYCAGYWDAWSNAIADGAVTDAQLEPLVGELKTPSVEFAAIAMLLMLDDADASEPEIAQAGIEARGLIADALAGKAEAAESLFRSLGTCQIEDE